MNLDLTDHQWALLEPLLPKPKPAPGRPPVPNRLVLDAIFYKLRADIPWYDLPNRYPPHQTVYRRYRVWKRDGVLNQALEILSDDLCERGGLDLQAAIFAGLVVYHSQTRTLHILLPLELIGAWQHATALLILSLIAREARPLLDKLPTAVRIH